jgi:hypothetical protein
MVSAGAVALRGGTAGCVFVTVIAATIATVRHRVSSVPVLGICGVGGVAIVMGAGRGGIGHVEVGGGVVVLLGLGVLLLTLVTVKRAIRVCASNIEAVVSDGRGGGRGEAIETGVAPLGRGLRFNGAQKVAPAAPR